MVKKMGAVLSEEDVKELEAIRKKLFENLNDYWDSQAFLGDTKALNRFVHNLHTFFHREVLRVKIRRFLRLRL